MSKELLEKFRNHDASNLQINEAEESVPYYRTALYQWMKANGWQVGAKGGRIYNYLCFRHSDETIAALEATEPFIDGSTDTCWTGNIYERRQEWLAVEVQGIPFAIFRDMKSQHLGYVGGKRRERWA